jgi:hypothetical protein
MNQQPSSLSTTTVPVPTEPFRPAALRRVDVLMKTGPISFAAHTSTGAKLEKNSDPSSPPCLNDTTWTRRSVAYFFIWSSPLSPRMSHSSPYRLSASRTPACSNSNSPSVRTPSSLASSSQNGLTPQHSYLNARALPRSRTQAASSIRSLWSQPSFSKFIPAGSYATNTYTGKTHSIRFRTRSCTSLLKSASYTPANN